jgi:hypothetical protein
MAYLACENFPHPAGESEKPVFTNKTSWLVDTPGGRVHAEWADDVPVTREGSLVFFFQFLAASDRWKEFIKEIPLHFSSNHASAPQDVFGTLLLSILNGHWRYAYIDSVRGDGVNPGLLGMHRTVSEDVVRRSLRRMDSTAALAWLEKHNRAALTTRPELMQGVAGRVESGAQKSIRVSILHRNAEALRAAITAISKEISYIAATVRSRGT